MRIPFNRATRGGDEERYLAEALAGGRLSGDGPFTQRCRAILEDLTGSEAALLTTSCTHALELSALLLDIGPGDEVIAPSFTFVSTLNAFVLRGATPVFADVRPDTLNLDERRLEGLITPRTKAIFLVHYAGVACEMEPILAIAARHGVAVVEDNAHGLFGTYRGRPLGSFGQLATLSFHETKNMSCGEGGALLINDPALVGRAEILREKGTNRSAFRRREVGRYEWLDVGSSWLPSDLLAAVLLAQLEARERIQARRAALWTRYEDGLADWARSIGATLPTVPPDRQQAFHMFWMLLPDRADRDRVIEELGRRGILAVFHYLPLHDSPMGRRLADRPISCPVTEDVSGRLVRLPFFVDLAETEQDEVIQATQDALPAGAVG